MCGNKFYSSMFFLPAEINSACVRRLLRFHIDHSMIDSTTIYNSKAPVFTLERTNELNVNSILKRLGLETWRSVNRIPRLLVLPPSLPIVRCSRECCSIPRAPFSRKALRAIALRNTHWFRERFFIRTIPLLFSPPPTFLPLLPRFITTVIL